MGDDEERRRPRELRSVPTVPGPDTGCVDDIEQSSTHDHSAGRRSRTCEDLRVDRVLIHDPGLELVDIADLLFDVGAGWGDVAVERHGDVGDHLRHGRLRRSNNRSCPMSTWISQKHMCIGMRPT
jgi:hypothetical protein